MRASTVGRRSLDRSGALYRFISTHDLYQRFYMVAVLYVYIYIIRASGGNSSRGDRTLVFIGCNDRAALLATLRRLPWLPSTRARGQLSELSASQVPRQRITRTRARGPPLRGLLRSSGLVRGRARRARALWRQRRRLRREASSIEIDPALLDDDALFGMMEWCGDETISVSGMYSLG